MSYIRSGSNPEGLYIVGLKEGVQIWHDVKPPLSSEWGPQNFIVPTQAFHQVCKQWNKGWVEKTTRKGLTVEEAWINVNGQNQCLIKLSYGNHFLHMWSTTWEYVVSNYINRNK